MTKKREPIIRKTYLRSGLKCLTLFLLVTLYANRINGQHESPYSTLDATHGLSDNQVRYILQLPDGRMVFTTSGNMNLFDGVGFNYIHRQDADVIPLKKYNGHYRIYQSKDSLLWIKDHFKLMCLDLRTETYLSRKEPKMRLLFAKPIDDLFVDSDKRTWVLTGDLLRIWGDKHIQLRIPDSGRLQDILSNQEHLYLFYETGEIVCYDLQKKRIAYARTAYSKQSYNFFKHTSLAIKKGSKIYQLRNGSKGGLFVFDTVGLIWKTVLITDYTLNTLITTQDGTLYITCSKGLWRIDKNLHKKTYIPNLKTVDGENIQTEISTIFADAQGGFWLGTFNRGLLYTHPARYKFNNIGRSYFSNREQTDFQVLGFAEDIHNKIYVKTNIGTYLYTYTPPKNHTIGYVFPNNLPPEIIKQFSKHQKKTSNPNETAREIDVRGWTWIGTKDGLRLIRSQGEKPQHFYNRDGLSNNFIHAILQDIDHNIWITTSSGITKIQIDPKDQSLHFAKFNALSGTLMSEYSQDAIFQSQAGTLFFGGINGFNTLESETKNIPQLPFKPVFTNLYLKGQRVEVGKEYAGRIILRQTPSFTQALELFYDQNFLSFEFSALNYQNPGQTYYRYQLQGIDGQWRETTADGHRITYTNLPIGKYNLRIHASTDNTNWQTEMTQIALTIHPPWWKTITAYILYSIFAIALLYIFIQAYTAHAKRKLSQRHQEEILLLRIRNLIEQCTLLETERDSYRVESKAEGLSQTETKQHSLADAEFISKAITLVEQHLDEPQYSVEQLSRDLFMDRTGLYRKLVALLDESPSLFIRNIRLQRAAHLLQQGNHSVSEISNRVGFSSSSYLSKCFQEVYGCKPSEYALKAKKST